MKTWDETLERRTFRIRPASMRIFKRNRRTGKFQSKRDIMLEALKTPVNQALMDEYG